MRFTSRMAILAAALSLPLGAALASYAIAADPPKPSVPAGVEIGEDAPSDTTGSTTSPTPPSPSPKPPPPSAPAPPPHTQVVPPAPPYSDDDDDDDGDDDDD